MTAHNEASKDQIAKIVFMAGDPLRAKFFADKYLKNVKLVNKVRNMLAFTGTLNNKKVTVMGHGMGMESIGIYSYELYKFYDVETIIRFGSCGAYVKDLNIMDIIVADEAYTDSNYGLAYGNKKDIAFADNNLLNISKEAAKDLNLGNKFKVGKIHSSLWFYRETLNFPPEKFAKQGLLAVEMESYALYSIAKILNKKALTILTVSDNLVTHEETTAIKRQEGFTDMFNLLIKIVEKL